MQVRKNTGDFEKFDKDKLCNSLKKAGAPNQMANHVCELVSSKVEPGYTTSKIFRESLKYLLKESIDLAARYSLPRAISSLGPAGFVFEQFFQTILESEGYKTKRNTFASGKCISHEVDILAEKGGKKYLIEAKYRNKHYARTHIDEVMYMHARSIDISNSSKGGKLIPWLVTNTKFTQTAIKYANCYDIQLTGWNYPKKDDLEDMIIRNKAYPVTVLPSVNKEALDALAKKDMVLAQDVLTYTEKELSKYLDIPLSKSAKIIKEAGELMKS